MLALVFLLISVFSVTAVYFLSGTAANPVIFFIAGILTAFIGLIALFFLLLLILSFFIDKEKAPKSPNSFCRYYMLGFISLLLGVFRVRIKKSGMEKLPDCPFLLVGNHQSVFDPMIEMLVLRKHNLAFVSKKENIAIPVGGKFMVAGGCISLDRENNRSAAKTISEAAERMKSGKYSMGIYPEGKSNKHPDEVKLLPFHSGSFKCATKANVPIVIAVIGNARGLQKRFFRPINTITLDIVDVISPEAYKGMTTSEISERVKDIILRFMDKEKAL